MTNAALGKLWNERRAAIGGWVAGGAEFSLDLYRRAGYDYVGIDCQHTSMNEATVASILQRTPPGSPPTIVRVSKNDSALIGRLADAGADGVIVPMVSSAQEAAAAVAAVQYPPAGVRSFGPMRADLPVADLDALAGRVSVFVMIETREGFENVDAITSVPGVGGVYIGPADLSIGLGLAPLAAFNTDQLVEPVETIRRSCDRAGVILGMHQVSAAGAIDWIGRGVRMVSMGSDSGTFLSAATETLEDVRSGTTGSAKTGAVISSPYG